MRGAVRSVVLELRARLLRALLAEEGMSTAEYAIGTVVILGALNNIRYVS